MIIPIPKPDKDLTNPTNYRPIALTSCLCKVFEWLVNNRLVWHLEHHGLLNNIQSGLKKGRNTIDHLVRLESFVRDAFINRQHMCAIFFDLEKAYDTAWRYGIMQDLHDMNFRGRLPRFISNFLSDRSFNVRLGATLSDLYVQENGVPQGSVLAPTLFTIKINKITEHVLRDVDCSLYVDDFLICYRADNMESIERKLQLNLHRLEKWANTNGFRFSTNKTVAVHFCNKRSLHPDPDLTLYGNKVPVVRQTRFLGLIFDNKLTSDPIYYN